MPPHSFGSPLSVGNAMGKISSPLMVWPCLLYTSHKVSLLMAHTDHPREVADPWFTGDFEATWQDILEGCTALLEELR